jgi:hemerythrin-like domain-containing protein
MKPIGPLMWEHRLIEKMVDLLRSEIDRITNRKTVNVILVEQAVDFFRTYADRTHHGKEEEILFRDLAQKKMAPEHRSIMDELIREHIHGRELVRRLIEAKDLYVNGFAETLPHIARELRELVDFYPGHIKRGQALFLPLSRLLHPGRAGPHAPGVPGLRPEHDPREVPHRSGKFSREKSDAAYQDRLSITPGPTSCACRQRPDRS